jgi:hypothetical protein
MAKRAKESGKFAAAQGRSCFQTDPPRFPASAVPLIWQPGGGKGAEHGVWLAIETVV